MVITINSNDKNDYPVMCHKSPVDGWGVKDFCDFLGRIFYKPLKPKHYTSTTNFYTKINIQYDMKTTPTKRDEEFIRITIRLAKFAKSKGDFPFGAILVKNNKIVAKTYDKSYSSFDPTRHAEIELISKFCKKRKLLSLEGYTLYSSTEPCNMCAGAIHWAKISRIVYSVPQKKLNEMSGVKPKIPCDKIINSCINKNTKKAEIVGNVLVKEGIEAFKNFKLMPKSIKIKSK